MKKIYVVHQDRRQNLNTIKVICNRLVRIGIMPISPVHAFSFLDDEIPEDRERALGFSRELIKSADEVWIFDNWKVSQKSRIEVTEASLQLKPIRIVTGWEDDYPVFKKVVGQNV